MSGILFVKRPICDFEDKLLPFCKRFAADNRFGTIFLNRLKGLVGAVISQRPHAFCHSERLLDCLKRALRIEDAFHERR